jgi:hypothetical protein
MHLKMQNIVTFTIHLNLSENDKKIESKNIFEFHAIGIYVTNSWLDVDMGVTEYEQFFQRCNR